MITSTDHFITSVAVLDLVCKILNGICEQLDYVFELVIGNIAIMPFGVDIVTHYMGHPEILKQQDFQQQEFHFLSLENKFQEIFCLGRRSIECLT